MLEKKTCVYLSFPPIIIPQSNPQVCGGFLFLNNTSPTLQLWNKVGAMAARDEDDSDDFQAKKVDD